MIELNFNHTREFKYSILFNVYVPHNVTTFDITDKIFDWVFKNHTNEHIDIITEGYSICSYPYIIVSGESDYQARKALRSIVSYIKRFKGAEIL